MPSKQILIRPIFGVHFTYRLHFPERHGYPGRLLRICKRLCRRQVSQRPLFPYGGYRDRIAVAKGRIAYASAANPWLVQWLPAVVVPGWFGRMTSLSRNETPRHTVRLRQLVSRDCSGAWRPLSRNEYPRLDSRAGEFRNVFVGAGRLQPGIAGWRASLPSPFIPGTCTALGRAGRAAVRVRRGVSSRLSGFPRG